MIAWALPILRFLEELHVGEMLASAVPKHDFPPSLVSLAVEGFVTWNDDVFARIPRERAPSSHPSTELRPRIEEALLGVRVEMR